MINHHGVASDDPRNQRPIAHFRPPDVTEDYIRRRFGRVFRSESQEQIDARVRQFLTDLAAKPRRPPPPLSQSIDEVENPFFQLGVHPDIVELLWRSDRALPLSSRWTVWGHPALVHPRTGVIFAVAIGTLGIVARLPPGLREGLATVHPLNVGEIYDISPAGPEWRFLKLPPDESHIVAAFEAAARGRDTDGSSDVPI
jgi:hypothetical protein